MCTVLLDWNDATRKAAVRFAAEMTDNREAQAKIVGMLYMSWPLLVKAAAPGPQPMEYRKPEDK